MLIINDIDPVVSLHHRLPHRLPLLRVINYQQRRTNDAVSPRVSRHLVWLQEKLHIHPDGSCLTPASPEYGIN